MTERDALDHVAKIVALLRSGESFQMIAGDEEALELVLEMATRAWVLAQPKRPASA